MISDSSKGDEHNVFEQPSSKGARVTDPIEGLHGGKTMADNFLPLASDLMTLPYSVDLSFTPDQLRRFADQTSKLRSSGDMDFEIVHGVGESDGEDDWQL